MFLPPTNGIASRIYRVQSLCQVGKPFKDLEIYRLKRAEQEGKYYHPAVNGKIDELTGGYSSRIQLEALLSNVLFAKKIGT